jgi:hypothetical protein
MAGACERVCDVEVSEDVVLPDPAMLRCWLCVCEAQTPKTGWTGPDNIARRRSGSQKNSDGQTRPRQALNGIRQSAILI